MFVLLKKNYSLILLKNLLAAYCEALMRLFWNCRKTGIFLVWMLQWLGQAWLNCHAKYRKLESSIYSYVQYTIWELSVHLWCKVAIYCFGWIKMVLLKSIKTCAKVYWQVKFDFFFFPFVLLITFQAWLLFRHRRSCTKRMITNLSVCTLSSWC